VTGANPTIRARLPADVQGQGLAFRAKSPYFADQQSDVLRRMTQILHYLVEPNIRSPDDLAFDRQCEVDLMIQIWVGTTDEGLSSDPILGFTEGQPGRRNDAEGTA
jgi:hypothetical protein